MFCWSERRLYYKPRFSPRQTVIQDLDPYGERRTISKINRKTKQRSRLKKKKKKNEEEVVEVEGEKQEQEEQEEKKKKKKKKKPFFAGVDL